jgi:hypothetical protein
MLHRLAGLALAVLALLVPASVAAAAPVTVNLRVEGSAATLFEGPVTTDAKPALATASSGGPHPCDVGENLTPPTATRAGNPTTALADSGVSWDATFDPNFADFLISRVGTDVAGTAFWGVAVNGQFPPLGGCQVPLNAGDDVLWVFDGFGKALLRLAGPTTATAGVPFLVTVRDQSTGAPVAGATVAGATTDAAGNASVTLTQPGSQRLKATAPAAVRSNALVVAVAGAGQAAGQVVAGITAGVVDRTAPRSRTFTPLNGHTYRRARFSPRTIRVRAGDSGSGIRNVKLRLTRRVGNRCSSYSGRRERFVGAKCGSGFFFTVSESAAVDYLLPEKLPRGHYVLDVVAIDKALNRDGVRQRGRNRSVFDVR